MKFSISQEDINRSKVLTPTWHECVIKNVTDKVSKSSGANMTQIDLVVSDNPNNPPAADKTPSAHVPLKPWYITEAGIGFALGFLGILAGKKIVAGDEIDSALLANAKGKKIRVFVNNEEYQGKVGNVASDFAAA